MFISRVSTDCYEIEDIVTQVPGTLGARVAVTSVFNERLGTEELLIFFVPNAACVSDSQVARLYEREQPSLAFELAELVSAVQMHVTKALSIAPKHCIPVTDSAFHRTTSGKIQRGAFKKEFLERMYEDVVALLAGPKGGGATSGTYTIAWPEAPTLRAPNALLNLSPFLYVGRHGALAHFVSKLHVPTSALSEAALSNGAACVTLLLGTHRRARTLDQSCNQQLSARPSDHPDALPVSRRRSHGSADG